MSADEHTRHKPVYRLIVRQQPERARLCSFKEENDTIDRRPVDPPPVVELQMDSLVDPLDSGCFFIRVSIVHPTPVMHPLPHYPPVKTQTGAEATTGELIQTPERLRILDGRLCAICIFTKLSVRMPGVFRLKFTLYEMSSGLVELSHTISEPFEVFSPKLFRGMRESTLLTRHLASQGLKIKLRTDTTVGRQSESRRSKKPPDLVWHSGLNDRYTSRHSGSPQRTGDDGMGPSLGEISRFNWTPVTDLSEFSLNRPRAKPNGDAHPRLPSLNNLLSM